MKIAVLSKYDFAGSGSRLCEALNQFGYSCISARYARTSGNDRFQYDYDLSDSELSRKTTENGLVEVTYQFFIEMQEFLNSADVVIFKGDNPPVNNWFGYQIPEKVVVIFLAGGSSFRRSDCKFVSFPRFKLSKYESADIRTSLTPEMCYPELDMSWFPAAYDVPERNPYILKPEGKTLIIGHSPSNREKKGTAKFLEATDRLIKERYNIKVKIIEKLSYEDCIKAKLECDIFYDQDLAGWVGNSGVESLANGIPTIAYLDPVGVQNCDDICPILNCHYDSAKGIYRAIYRLLDRKYRGLISNLSHIYALRTHSNLAVAGRFAELLIRSELT